MTATPGSAAPSPVGMTEDAGDERLGAPRRTPDVAIAARRTQWALFIGLAAVIVITDQLAKLWITANHEVGIASPVLGDNVRIWLSHNTGALFGLFRDQASIFAVFSLVVVGVIVWYEAQAGGSLLVTLALGMLLGGALGNLTDRIRLGYVVDFVDFGLGPWRFYTFNVADSAITGSVLLLLLLAVAPVLMRANRGS